METYVNITEIILFSNTSVASNQNHSITIKSVPAVRTEVFNFLMYFAIVLCIVGSAGNILIIKIMRRKRFRIMPRSLICLTLAITDLVFLINYFITEILAAIGVNIYLTVWNFSCRLYLWLAPLMTFLMHVDAWLVTMMSCERLTAVVWPLQVHTIITRGRIKAVICFIIIFFILFDFEESVRPDYFHLDVCSLDDKLFSGIFYIKFQVTVYLVSVVPLMVIIPTNIIIVIYLIKHVKAQRNMGSGTRHSNEAQKVTLMLVSVSLAFIILVGPIAVYALMRGQGGTTLHGICLLLQLVNFVINIFLYFFSGEIFRQEVMAWFRSLHTCGKDAEESRLNTITRDSATHYTTEGNL